VARRMYAIAPREDFVTRGIWRRASWHALALSGSRMSRGEPVSLSPGFARG
jgi:hypothetical protein